jgi:hypothetical protein
MAAYMGSSFTGGLPAIAATATCITLKIAGDEQQDFPPTEPYAIPRNDTTECVTLVARQFRLGDKVPPDTVAELHQY